MKVAPAQVREELVEPSGPFLVSTATLPPEDVLEHLDARPPSPKADEIVLEPSGPLTVPGATSPPMNEETPASVATGPAAATPEPVVPSEADEVVVEPSGPFLTPSASPDAAPGAALFDQGGNGHDPDPPAGQTGVVGVAHGAPRRGPAVDPDPSGPSVVVDQLLGRRAEPTTELPRELRMALTPAPRPQTAWMSLAVAFTLGMLTGAAIAVAILKL